MFQVSTTNFHTTRSIFRKLNMALFNRTARLHTRQSWLKTELLPTAVNSLVKMNGLRTCPTSTLWTTMSGELCLNATSHLNPSRRTAVGSRKFCSWYGTSSHWTRSTKPYLAFQKEYGLCASWWWTLRAYAKMNYLSLDVSWKWKLQVSVDYSVQNWTYGIEYLYSHNFGEI